MPLKNLSVFTKVWHTLRIILIFGTQIQVCHTSVNTLKNLRRQPLDFPALPRPRVANAVVQAAFAALPKFDDFRP